MLYLTLAISLLSMCLSAYTIITIPDPTITTGKLEENVKKLEKKLQSLIVDTNDHNEGFGSRISKIEKKLAK